MTEPKCTHQQQMGLLAARSNAAMPQDTTGTAPDTTISGTPAVSGRAFQVFAPRIRPGDVLIHRTGEWSVVAVRHRFPTWVITVATHDGGTLDLPMMFFNTETIRRPVPAGA